MPSDRCAHCGHDKVSVTDSRTNSLHERVRRRCCDRCGARWNTVEIDANDLAAPALTRDAVRAAMAALEKVLDLLPVNEVAGIASLGLEDDERGTPLRVRAGRDRGS